MRKISLTAVFTLLFLSITILAEAQSVQVYRHPYLRLQLRRIPASWEMKSYKDQILMYAPKEEGRTFDGENISINGFELPEGETCNTVYKRYVTEGLGELSNYYEVSEVDTMIGGKSFMKTVFTFSEEGKMWKDVMCTICVNNRFYIFLLTATPNSYSRYEEVFWDLLFFSKPD